MRSVAKGVVQWQIFRYCENASLSVELRVPRLPSSEFEAHFAGRHESERFIQRPALITGV